MLFLSTYKNKVDKKCRVSIPSQFRTALSNSSFQGVILHKSIANNCIEGMGLERLEKITEMIDNLDPFSPEKDAFETVILGGSVQLSFDSEGRVILPVEMVERYGINETAIFVGKGSSFQIWSEEEFAKHSEDSRKIALENRDKIRVIK